MQLPCAFGVSNQFGGMTPAPQPSVASPQYNVFATAPARRARRVASYSGGMSSGNYGASYGGGYSAMGGTSGVPQSLIDRVIARESGGNARAVSHGNYGLMQIRLGTARAMGYTGSAAGLLDPQTNMTYAVRYLAGAYRAAGGNEARAIALYQHGYYYQAKRQGFSPYESGVTTASFNEPAPQSQYNNLYAYASNGGAPVVHRFRHHRHAV